MMEEGPRGKQGLATEYHRVSSVLPVDDTMVPGVADESRKRSYKYQELDNNKTARNRSEWACIKHFSYLMQKDSRPNSELGVCKPNHGWLILVGDSIKIKIHAWLAWYYLMPLTSY